MEEEYDLADSLWQSGRLLLCVFISIYSQSAIMSVLGMAEDSPDKPFYTALALGYLIYSWLMLIFKYLVSNAFGVEPLSPQDNLYSLDNEKNVANFVCAIILERMNLDTMKKLVLAKTAQPRLRSKIVKLGGMKWYKRLSEDEWKAHEKAFMQVQANVHSSQQLNQLMTLEMHVAENINAPQLKFHLIPEYTDAESAIVIKCHHSLLDEEGFLNLVKLLSDKSTNGKVD